MQLHGRMHILRESRGVSTDGIEGRTSECAVRAYCLHGAVTVHAHHHRPVKMVGLLRSPERDKTFALVTIGLHALHKTDGSILKIGKNPVKEFGYRFMIRIEYNTYFPGSLFKC